jgi:hypothetical protein
VSTRSEELEHNKQVLIDYLLMKVSDSDWHGVADAAMDLRDLEAELKALRSLNLG